jgi:hypothetical protein
MFAGSGHNIKAAVETHQAGRSIHARTKTRLKAGDGSARGFVILNL